MALIYNDVAEVVFRVMGGQEVSGVFLVIDIQGLIGGDEDTGILFGVACGNRSGIGTKDNL